jgi:citrate lyase subunit beta / citryl-CoA lyase
MALRSYLMALRSYLYVPADRPDRIARAFGRGADALILDLEDAVAPARKLEARDYLTGWLPSAQAPVWIRVNGGGPGVQDVRALASSPGISGFCLAKASIAQVLAITRVLEAARSRAALVPILEDAAAVLDARAIASLPRVTRLQLGEADLRAQLGIRPSADERELLAIRSQVVLASAAAGISAPTAPASVNFTDLAAFATSTQALRRLGFSGRTCIHPAQVEIVNREFTPSTAEIQQARSVLTSLDAGGGGPVRGPDGEMLDEASARAARRDLGQAGAGAVLSSDTQLRSRGDER